MNKKLIALVVLALTGSLLSAHCYRDKNGRWYCYDKKTGTDKELFTVEPKGYQDRERHNPYQKKSDYTSFGSDRTFVDQTHNNMGNR